MSNSRPPSRTRRIARVLAFHVALASSWHHYEVQSQASPEIRSTMSRVRRSTADRRCLAPRLPVRRSTSGRPGGTSVASLAAESVSRERACYRAGGSVAAGPSPRLDPDGPDRVEIHSELRDPLQLDCQLPLLPFDDLSELGD